MLPAKFIEEYPDLLREESDARFMPDYVTTFLELNSRRKLLLSKVELLRSKRKFEVDREALKALKFQIKEVESQLKPLELEVREYHLRIPNIALGPRREVYLAWIQENPTS